MLNLEKLLKCSSSNIHKLLDNYIFVIIKSLKHPDVFIKKSTMRLIQFILNSYNIIASKLFLNEDLVAFLFVNFKFFLVNKDTTDKL